MTPAQKITSVRINYSKNLGFENGKYTIECELEYDSFTKLFWGKINENTLSEILKIEPRKQKKAFYFAIKEQLIDELIEWQEMLDNQN